MASFRDRLRSLLPWPSPSLAPNEPAHPFDRAHKVDTSGLYYADRLPTGHAHDQYSEGYYATAPSLFLGALAQWRATLPAADGLPDPALPKTGLRVEDYTFVDLGCGKGRVLLMASMFPFRAVRGIELNAKLVRIARHNLRKWTKAGRAVSGDVQVICGDVLGSKHDPVLERVLDAGGPVVLFLFNSFAAEVLAGLMEKLAGAARPPRHSPIDLVYVHPEHDRLVAATPGIELLRHAEIPFSYDDAQADLFGVSSDICSVWRLGASYSSL